MAKDQARQKRRRKRQKEKTKKEGKESGSDGEHRGVHPGETKKIGQKGPSALRALSAMAHAHALRMQPPHAHTPLNLTGSVLMLQYADAGHAWHVVVVWWWWWWQSLKFYKGSASRAR